MFADDNGKMTKQNQKNKEIRKYPQQSDISAQFGGVL
jgi:hypothetical protein